MKIRYITSLCLILIFNYSFSQNLEKSNYELIGEWQSYKITTLEGDDGSQYTLDGKPFRDKITFEFEDNRKVYYSINGSEKELIDYELTNNTLRIGVKKFKILEVNDNKLVLEEIKLMRKIIYLKKVK